MPNPRARSPLCRRDDLRPRDALIADVEDPAVREFVVRELLLGTVRTIPTGPGRLLILPAGQLPETPDTAVDWHRTCGHGLRRSGATQGPVDGPSDLR